MKRGTPGSTVSIARRRAEYAVHGLAGQTLAHKDLSPCFMSSRFMIPAAPHPPSAGLNSRHADRTFRGRGAHPRRADREGADDAGGLSADAERGGERGEPEE